MEGVRVYGGKDFRERYLLSLRVEKSMSNGNNTAKRSYHLAKLHKIG